MVDRTNRQIPASPTEYRYFGDYALDLTNSELLLSNKVVPLEPQTLSVLAYLCENRHRVVPKDELLDEIWGHRYVTESALATQIKTLRKALGDDGRSQKVIRTRHRRGYQFVAELEAAPTGNDSIKDPQPDHHTLSNLRNERTPLYGREDDIQDCLKALDKHRLVSLLGIGGTGKTRLAKAVGLADLSSYPDGVWFVDLVPATDAAGIDASVAASMGLAISSASPRQQIMQSIATRQSLIILDNCEHIGKEVAHFIDDMLDHTSNPRFLLTSRDPVNLADEFKLFLTPLPVGNLGEQSPAIALFVATAKRHGVANVAATEATYFICKQLDGLPLAIEMAASQLIYLSEEELAHRLDRRFEVLTKTQSKSATHQASLLQVVKDTWDMLATDEQNLLVQLSVFTGPFTVTDIEELVSEGYPSGISGPLARIVELCLIHRTAQPGAWWKVLETVRMFVINEAGEKVEREKRTRHGNWILSKLGTYPHDHLDNFSQAQWAREHYADLTAAEQFFDHQGEFESAIAICCAVGLMIQLDEGALALPKLERIERYLQRPFENNEGVQLHGMASLCAQILHARDKLSHHIKEHLRISREINEPNRLAGALILQSLTTSFEEAKVVLDEALMHADSIEDNISADSIRSFWAWHLAIRGQLAEARELSLDIIRRNPEHEHLNIPVHNAICTVIACSVTEQPALAYQWLDLLVQYPTANSLWGAQLVMACAYAANGHTQKAIEICHSVKERLEHSGRTPWPDLLVPAAMLAFHQGEVPQAQQWLYAVKQSGLRLDTFHVTTVYLALRTQIGYSEIDVLQNMSLSELGEEVFSRFREDQPS